MSGEILGDEDPQFAADLEQQIQSRRLVRLLATLRNKKSLTQQDVARVLGCRQARISKIENGTDAAVSMNEIEAYAKAADCDVELVIRSRSATLTDEIRHHAACIRQCVQRLAQHAQDGEDVSRAVATFHLDALNNLADALGQLTASLEDRVSEPRIQVRGLVDGDCSIDENRSDPMSAGKHHAEASS